LGGVIDMIYSRGEEGIRSGRCNIGVTVDCIKGGGKPPWDR